MLAIIFEILDVTMVDMIKNEISRKRRILMEWWDCTHD